MNKSYQIKVNLFPGLIETVKKNITTLEEAEKLRDKWNRESDCYTDYSVEECITPVDVFRDKQLKIILDE